MLCFGAFSMAPRPLRLDEIPVIGKRYLVPCLSYPHSPRNPWVPVLGTRHEDADVIGFTQEHFHYDFRFISDYQVQLIATFSRLHSQLNLPLEVLLPCLMNCVTTRPGPVVSRSRLCYRAMPVFPSHHGPNTSSPLPFMEKLEKLEELEEAYRDAKVTTCGTCPHRGMNLNGVPADEQGRKVCPLHGLRWNREGNLAPRLIQNDCVQSP
jgi:hypothetical protein